MTLISDRQFQIASRGSTFDVRDITGGIDARRFYINSSGNSYFSGDVSLSAGALSITADGSNATVMAESGSGDFEINTVADIVLDAGGGDILLRDDSTNFGSLTNSSGNLIVKSGTTTMLTGSGANATFSGDVGVTGNLTVTGLNYGLYHAENALNEDSASGVNSGNATNYYHDPYGGRRHLSIFLKNPRSDIIRYQPIDNVQYWDGSAWQDGSSQLANVKKLLDGRQDTTWSVPSTYYSLDLLQQLLQLGQQQLK